MGAERAPPQDPSLHAELPTKPSFSCKTRKVPRSRTEGPSCATYAPSDVNRGTGVSERAPSFTARQRLGELAHDDDTVSLPRMTVPGPTYVEGTRPGPALRTGGNMRETRFWD